MHTCRKITFVFLNLKMKNKCCNPQIGESAVAEPPVCENPLYCTVYLIVLVTSLWIQWRDKNEGNPFWSKVGPWPKSCSKYSTSHSQALFFALRCEIEWGEKKANFTRSSSLEQFFEIDVKCAYFELLKFSVKLHIKNDINFVFPEVH